MTSGAFAQVEESKVASLRNLAGIGVIVEAMAPDVERDGLTSSQLKADVEFRLRQAGIQILTMAEEQHTPEAPSLYLQVNAMKSDLLSYAVTISVSLRQWMVLKHDSEVQILAPTWGTSAVAVVGEKRLWKVRGYVVDEVDKFISAYQIMNPKGGVNLARP